MVANGQIDAATANAILSNGYNALSRGMGGGGD
jgi:hypothetical protein